MSGPQTVGPMEGPDHHRPSEKGSTPAPGHSLAPGVASLAKNHQWPPQNHKNYLQEITQTPGMRKACGNQPGTG